MFFKDAGTGDPPRHALPLAIALLIQCQSAISRLSIIYRLYIIYYHHQMLFVVADNT